MKSNLILIGFCAMLLAGCASNNSLVKSNPAADGKVQEGVVYSLPMQLVKLTYKRMPLDASKAAEAKKKAEELVKASTAAVEEKKKEEKTLADLIANVDSSAPNADAVIAKYNLELTQVKAAKLLLTNTLAEAVKNLDAATLAYNKSLSSNDAFSESLTLSAETPIPDPTGVFYAIIDHSFNSSDSIELKTKNGLLDGAIGHSEDKTGEIIVSLVSSFYGFRGVPSGTFKYFAISKPSDEDTNQCIKANVVSVEHVFNPDDTGDIDIVNRSLKAGCLRLEPPKMLLATKKPAVAPGSTTPWPAGTVANGLLYRQPGPYIFEIKDTTTVAEATIQRFTLNLSQGGAVGSISLPKGQFAKNEFDNVFSNGMLVKSKTTQPSEVLGVAMIIPDALRAIFAIPTELIQLKFDYSSKEKEMLVLKKEILDAQLELDKKQLEVEKSLSVSETIE